MMNHEDKKAYELRLKGYKARISEIQQAHPVGYLMVAAAVGSLPPLPPPEVTQAEIDDDLAMLERVILAAEAALR